MHPGISRQTVVIVSGIITATLGFAFAGWQFTGADNHDLPPWIEASATVLALIAASAAALYAIAAFQIETNRENRFVETQRRAQAAVVAAWPDQVVSNPFDGVRARLPRTIVLTDIGFRLRNASDVPVTAVELKAVCGAEDLGVQYVGLVPPTDEPIFMTWDRDIQALIKEIRQTAPDAVPDVVLSFVDAAGVMWTRDQYGELTEGWFPEE